MYLKMKVVGNLVSFLFFLLGLNVDVADIVNSFLMSSTGI